MEDIRMFSIKLKTQKGSIMLEDVIEIISPISWLTSARRYLELIQQWIKTRIPDANHGVNLIKCLVDQYSSIKFNTRTTMPIILQQTSSIELNLQMFKAYSWSGQNRKYPSWKQELIHQYSRSSQADILCYSFFITTSYLNLIKPLYYINDAILATKTKTSSRFKTIYRLNNDTMDCIYEKLSNKLSKDNTMLMEKIGCEFLRDFIKKKQIPEKKSRNLQHQHWTKKCRFPDTTPWPWFWQWPSFTAGFDFVTKVSDRKLAEK